MREAHSARQATTETAEMDWLNRYGMAWRGMVWMAKHSLDRSTPHPHGVFYCLAYVAAMIPAFLCLSIALHSTANLFSS